MKTLYFSHDCNAGEDSKLMEARIDHGNEAYAVFFLLLERMREAPEYKLECKYKVLARLLFSTEEIVKAVVEDYGLFVVEDGWFTSPGFVKRMKLREERYEEVVERNRANGMKGGRPKTQNNPDKTQNNPDKTQNNPDETEPKPNINPDETQNNPKIKRKIKINIKEDADASSACARAREASSLFSSIFQKFQERTPGLVETREQREAFQRLVNVLGGESEAEEKIRQGLDRLETARAIVNGRVRMTIEAFLKPENFSKLITGAFDVDYEEERVKRRQEARPPEIDRFEAKQRILEKAGCNSTDMNGEPSREWIEDYPNRYNWYLEQMRKWDAENQT